MEPRERGRQIGLMPQRAEIHWDIDVSTLVGLGRMPHRGRWGLTDADKAAIASAMAATDVTALRHRKALRLSGGEQGRVLLARVLAGEPRWLLADEPLASLDPAHQLDVLDRLREAARRGAGVVVVLHDLTHAARVADDALVLRDGQLLAAGAAAEVLTPDVLAQAYGVEVHLARTADGAPIIVPVRRVSGTL
jgi:iron complex transport system ATP-binding protein